MQHQIDPSSLSDLEPFRQLARAQIAEILDQGSIARYDAGREIFSEGMPADRFFLLLDGHLRVVRLNENGGQTILRHIHAGQLFGIAKAVGQKSFPASAITASESIALSWPTKLWTHFVENYESFAAAAYSSIGDRLVEMNSMVVELATYAVEQRVASAVLRMAQQSGRPDADGVRIDFPVTRLNVSEMTGTTLHTVSRLLSAWQKAGIISSRRKQIVVTDMAKLEILTQPKEAAPPA